MAGGKNAQRALGLKRSTERSVTLIGMHAGILADVPRWGSS